MSKTPDFSTPDNSTLDPSWKPDAEDLRDELDDRNEDLNMSLDLFSPNFSLSSPDVSPSLKNVGLVPLLSNAENEVGTDPNEDLHVESVKERKNNEGREAVELIAELDEEAKESEDGEVSDIDDASDEEDIKYTAEELLAFNEIDTAEIDEDIESFLRKTENNNTRDQTESMICKYHRIMSVVAKKEGEAFLPLDSTPIEKIPTLLARFFKLVRMKNGEIYNASSYTTYFGCFARKLSEVFEVDIKKDPRFKIVRTTISRLKKKAQGTKGKKPGANASKVVAPRHLQMAWRCGSIGRSDPEALVAAAYMAFTTGLGCRAVKEVLCVTNEAVKLGPINDKTGVPEYIELDEQWVTKNRNGDDPKILEAKITADDKFPEVCMVRTLCEMQRRKTEFQKEPQKRFFWNINDSARKNPNLHETWFKNQVMGKHTISAAFPKALSKAGIDVKQEKYSATSARKVLLDGGLDAGIPEVLLGKLAGHKSLTAKRQYIEKKDLTHRAANIAINRVAAGYDADYKAIFNDEKEKDKLMLESIRDVHEDLNDDDDEEEQHCISQSRIMSEHGSIEIYNEVKKKSSSRRKRGNSMENIRQLSMGVQQSPSNMGVQQSPSNMGVQQSPSNMGVQQSPSNMGVQQSPSNMAVQQSSSNMAVQQTSMGARQSMMTGVQQNMSGIQQPNIGAQHFRMAVQQPGMGLQQSGTAFQSSLTDQQFLTDHMGVRQSMMGGQQSMTGVQQSVTGIQQSNIGVQQFRMGLQQPGMGLQQPGMGLQQSGMGLQQSGTTVQSSLAHQQFLPHHLRNSVSQGHFLGNTLNNTGTHQLGNMSSFVRQPFRSECDFITGQSEFQMDQQRYWQAGHHREQLEYEQKVRFGPRPGEPPFLPWEQQLPNFVQRHLLKELNPRFGMDRIGHLGELSGFENVLSHGYRPHSVQDQLVNQQYQQEQLLQRQQQQHYLLPDQQGIQLYPNQQYLLQNQRGLHLQQRLPPDHQHGNQQMQHPQSQEQHPNQVPEQHPPLLKKQQHLLDQSDQKHLPIQAERKQLPVQKEHQQQLSVQKEHHQQLSVQKEHQQLSVQKEHQQQRPVRKEHPQEPSLQKEHHHHQLSVLREHHQQPLLEKEQQQQLPVQKEHQQKRSLQKEHHQQLPAQKEPQQKLAIEMKRQQQVSIQKEQQNQKDHGSKQEYKENINDLNLEPKESRKRKLRGIDSPPDTPMSKSLRQEKFDTGESSRGKENVSKNNLSRQSEAPVFQEEVTTNDPKLVTRTTSHNNFPKKNEHTVDDRSPGLIMLHKTRSQAWPVKITSIDATGIDLYYFGTAQTGHVKGWNPLFKYTLENKAKFGLNSKLKGKLKTAVEEADAELVDK